MEPAHTAVVKAVLRSCYNLATMLTNRPQTIESISLAHYAA
jgi:hypothetical protein